MKGKQNLPEIEISNNFWGRPLLGLKLLIKLALDIEWSYNSATENIWKSLDEGLWEKTHNPWVILQSIPVDILKKKLKDKDFLTQVKNVIKDSIQLRVKKKWFHKEHADATLNCIAYFSMEYMLSESLPIYVGGLGNVAGDQLKSANDLGVPVIGIGLLYQKGYFRQRLDPNGNQEVLNPTNDSSQLPITPVRKKNGEWLRLKIKFPNEDLWIRVWQVIVGNTRLFLLDTNDSANSAFTRGITSEIYGGDATLRIQQEIVLGIGGYRTLMELGLKPQVCHLNEGHSAFLILERARHFMLEKKCNFEEALYATRMGNLFTTHTAVAAGFDYFNSDLLQLYFKTYATEELGITTNTIENLGKINPNNTNENFSMAILAMNGCAHVNAVSKLHSEVSKTLFSARFPRIPIHEIPIDYVTNGIHIQTWCSEIASKLWQEAFGENIWKNFSSLSENTKKTELSDELIWKSRKEQKKNLVDIIREKACKELYLLEKSQHEPDFSNQIFDTEILTIGFARRFVPYKRNDLLLHDEQRLLNIIHNKNQPIQIVIAGKAPPFDQGGNEMIAHWIHFIQKNQLHHKVIFLSDYDIQLAQNMVQGVDIWLNTPRRPWEACGTSGMKILANGGLNLSVLDGWWAEAYNNKVGWAIGNGQENENYNLTDKEEANQLYDLLENEIIPQYYDRNTLEIPEKWVAKLRQSLLELTPTFSSDRAVKQYTQNHYLPLEKLYRERSTKKVESLKKDLLIIQSLKENWSQIDFTEIETKIHENGFTISVKILADKVLINHAIVQIYADATNEFNQETYDLKPDSQQNNLFKIDLQTLRTSEDFTLRVIPDYTKIASPLELPLVRWQR